MELREAKPKSTSRTSEDLISKLPDEILTHILSFLPTKSSVKTSVLSKRWSRLWISVPTLDFNGFPFNCSVRQTQFENFMDRFLSYVRSFRAINLKWAYGVSDVSRVNAWLAAFGERGAEKIDLSLRNGAVCSLPDTFFVQNNLVELKLTTVNWRVPQLVCFPNLEKIELRYIRLVDETSVKNLLCGSPVLSTLNLCLDEGDSTKTLHIGSSSLCNLRMKLRKRDYNVVIDSPNLTYLSLTHVGLPTYYNVINASLLARAHLCIQDGEILLKLLTQISHVKELHLDLTLTSFFPDTSLANLPMLHNLIYLKVDLVMEENCQTLSHLLHCTPNLVTIILNKAGRDDIYAWFESYEVPQCFLSRVESVDIKWVRDGDHDLRMIAYILKNAMVLNKLSIHSRSHKLFNETKFLTTVLNLPRGSATCQVEYSLDTVLIQPAKP